MNEPRRYAGNGITCADALESMAHGCDLPPMALWWWGCALKYLWRWPWKNGAEDLGKARDCVDRLASEVFGRRVPATDANGEPIRAGDSVKANGRVLTVEDVLESDDPEEPERLVFCGEFVEGMPVTYIAEQDEVAEHAQACGTCGSFRRCCECGSGWCMELLEPTNEADEACEEHDPDADGRARA